MRNMTVLVVASLVSLVVASSYLVGRIMITQPVQGFWLVDEASVDFTFQLSGCCFQQASEEAESWSGGQSAFSRLSPCLRTRTRIIGAGARLVVGE